MRDIVSVTLSCLLLATPLWAGPGSATISASAAAAGTPRGVEVNLATDATSDRFFFLEDSTPANEDAYGATFYTRLDDLRLAPGNQLDHLVGLGAGGDVLFRIGVVAGATPGAHNLVLAARLDDGTYETATSPFAPVLPAGYNRINVIWRALTRVVGGSQGEPGGPPGGAFGSIVPAGELLVSVNGEPFLGLTALGNGGMRLETVRWGAVSGTLTTSTGRLQFDEFTSIGLGLGPAWSPIFADGFETGDLCAWEFPDAQVTAVTPNQGGRGTTIRIAGRGFGNVRPQVSLGGAPLSVVSFSDALIEARLVQPLKAGRYGVQVAGCRSSVGGSSAGATGFEVRGPSPEAFGPRFVRGGDSVSMTGTFLGSEPGRVQVRPSTDTAWLDVAVQSWSDTAVSFTMPSPLTRNGDHDVMVTNDAGSVVVAKVLVGMGVRDGDTEGIRLISAVATTNTTVVVQFSEAVQGGLSGAENPAYYSITGPALPTGTGTAVVFVVSAEVLGPTFTTVRLTTLSQSNLLYTLTAVNIRDLPGNAHIPPVANGPRPNQTTFAGIAPFGTAIPDADDDGLSDADEQAGWVVTVTQANGSKVTRLVTSDPASPDTDGDHVSDKEEKHAGLDPRTADTDGDTLSDDFEWSTLLSDGTNQDSDGDTLQDGLEYFTFRTSPLLADTDGDQLPDVEEILAGQRNALIADLPAPRIRIGNVNLQLNTTFTITNEKGESSSDSSTHQSTLTRGEDESLSTSSVISSKDTVERGQEYTSYIEISGQIGFSGADSFLAGKAGFSQTQKSSKGSEEGYMFTASKESSRSTEEAFQASLTTSKARDVRDSVTRQISDAAVKMDVTIENLGNVPFSISNLELTAQTQNPQNRREIIPVASLVPENPELGDPDNPLNIGTIRDASRGPFVFKTVSVFPQQVQELMKNPRGLIVQLANYDITTEDGRNFAFVDNDVLDRTAHISFDLGDGRTESYRVATAAGNDRVTGKPLGITMGHALTQIIGLHRLKTIRDGGDGIVDTTKSGDDVQESNLKSRVEPGAVIVTAGTNGVLDTVSTGGDDIAFEPDYATGLTPRLETIVDGGNGTVDTTATGDDCQFVYSGSAPSNRPADCGTVQSGPPKRGQILIGPGQNGIIDTPIQSTGDSDDQKVVSLPHKVLTRFRDVAEKKGTSRFWVLVPSRELPDVDLESIVVRSGEQYTFAYVQDRDKDGVWAAEEYLHGTSDLLSDTDKDGLTDKQEIQDGWEVQVKGTSNPTSVYPNPTQQDSDRDSLFDREEARCLLDPRQRDTDGDGLSDYEELMGLLDEGGDNGKMVSRDPLSGDITYRITPYAGPSTAPTGLFPHDVVATCTIIPVPSSTPQSFTTGFATDPLKADTDGDGVNDLAELRLGLNPNDNTDGAGFLDDDGDGVPNKIESNGFDAIVNGVTERVTSNPNNTDSDRDGLPDLLEHFIRSNPRSGDTDGDGIADADEYRGAGAACVTVEPHVQCTEFRDVSPRGLALSPTTGNFREYLLACNAADVCNDEAVDAYLQAINARRYGTNLNERDSDFDGLDDKFELTAPRTIRVDGATRSLPVPVSDPLRTNSDDDGWGDWNEVGSETTAANTDTESDILTFESPTRWVTGTKVTVGATGGGLQVDNEYYYRATSDSTGSLHATPGDALGNTGKIDLTGVIDATLTGSLGTDPRSSDTDADGLFDDEEFGTTAFKVNLGGAKVARDPLWRDRLVTLQYTQIAIDGDCDGGSDAGDFLWSLQYQTPGVPIHTAWTRGSPSRQVSERETIFPDFLAKVSFVAKYETKFKLLGFLLEEDNQTTDSRLTWDQDYAVSDALRSSSPSFSHVPGCGQNGGLWSVSADITVR